MHLFLMIQEIIPSKHVYNINAKLCVYVYTTVYNSLTARFCCCVRCQRAISRLKMAFISLCAVTLLEDNW